MAAALRSLPLFDGVGDEPIEALERLLVRRDAAAGQTLLTEGAPSEEFIILVAGEVSVSAAGAETSRPLARVGGGTVFGEIGLLTGRPRIATVMTTQPSVVLTGGQEGFEELLTTPLVHERLVGLARTRLASGIEPIELQRGDGGSLLLRPILPTDRDALVEAIRTASAETLSRRFLSGGPPSSATINYLVRVDYVDHFAWVALDPRGADQPIGVGRYVRLQADPETAEVAFTVRDDAQGRGMGTLLLGAVGAVAKDAHISRFVASTRSDNIAMIRVLTRVGATFDRDEPGLTSATVEVDRAASLLAEPDRDRLRDAAVGLVTLTG